MPQQIALAFTDQVQDLKQADVGIIQIYGHYDGNLSGTAARVCPFTCR
jgi:hypothetical protein